MADVTVLAGALPGDADRADQGQCLGDPRQADLQQGMSAPLSESGVQQSQPHLTHFMLLPVRGRLNG